MKTQFIQFAASLVLMSSVSLVFAQTDTDIYNNDGIKSIKTPVKEVPVISVKPDFVLTAKLPIVPEYLAVFNVVSVDPTQVDPATTLAGRAFGFKSVSKKKYVNSKKSVSVMHTDLNNRTMELFDSGAVFIKNNTLLDEAGPDLLSNLNLDRESAKKYYAEKAKDFLAQTKLGDDNLSLREITFGDLTIQKVKSGVETKKVIAAAANYGISLNGVPTWGPGSATRVFFDSKGVSGFYSAAPNLKQGRTVALVKPEVAVQKYISAGTPSTLIRQHVGVVYKVDIKNIDLVYYLDSSNSSQQLVTPQYLISGEFHGQDLSGEKSNLTSEFKWLMPAI